MRIIGISLTLAACLLLARPVVAGDGCGAANRCAHCGCGAACQQVSCQIVAGVTKVKKYNWVVKEEPVCPLKPGCIPCLHDTLGGLLGGHGCEAACTACGETRCGGTCEKAKCMVPPQCGKPRVRKILVKKEYEVEVPVYKCEAKFLCSQCGVDPAVIGPKPGPGPGPAPVPVPPPPTPGSMQGVPIPPPPAPVPHQRASAEVAPLPAIN